MQWDQPPPTQDGYDGGDDDNHGDDDDNDRDDDDWTDLGNCETCCSEINLLQGNDSFS